MAIDICHQEDLKLRTRLHEYYASEGVYRNSRYGPGGRRRTKWRATAIKRFSSGRLALAQKPRHPRTRQRPSPNCDVIAEFSVVAFRQSDPGTHP
jgi:hypothetical protein